LPFAVLDIADRQFLVVRQQHLLAIDE